MALYGFETRGQLEPWVEREWLLTNGLGSFSSSTVVGCNTRRYHGLLCAATAPPVGRMMAFSRLGEILRLNDSEQLLEFSSNRFSDRWHPRGDQYLRKFSVNGIARFEYDIEGVSIIKEVMLLWMRNVAAVRYTLRADNAKRRLRLSLLPFTGLRDFHALRRAGTGGFHSENTPNSVQVTADGNRLFVAAEGASFRPGADWWYGHKYPIETERGQDDTEDLFCPGRFEAEGAGQLAVTLWAGIEPMEELDWGAEVMRVQGGKKDMGETPALRGASTTVARLKRAAADFIVARKTPAGKAGTTIIAGYPWFADWGRDTMISLPGLLLCTGRFEEAKQVLSVFASYVSEGMIPNRFDDYTNEPSYNTVDASLWFIHAVHEYARLARDPQTYEMILKPACREIIAGYSRGTRFGIAMDPRDGLITQGDANTQLTWMDAKCNGIAFTPRQGKAVEINALWYHALVLMGETDRAARVAESFRLMFWISPWRGLCDVVDGSRKDQSIRPNQIFAVSLPNSPLLPEQQLAVVEVVRRELLTPVGLRTLAVADSRYHGRYTGPQMQRDEAYHNGTVWPWLIGGFLEGYLKVNQNSKEARDQCQKWLMPLIARMDDECIGQLSEIYEGNAPHRAVGCCAQAWSIAEALRLAMMLEM